MTDSGFWCLYCLRPDMEGQRCPHCGTQADEVGWAAPCLRPGTMLQGGKYLVGRALGQGGFGITYLGVHLALNKRVAIKEYYPDRLARTRTGGCAVTPKADPELEALYRQGLEQFQEEGRRIVHFMHPNIVRATDYLEENGTAYLVMDYVDGVSLQKYLEQHGNRMSEAKALQLMQPVMDGLRAVHKAGFLHRDVKPSNIYLTESGQVILLDFGSARQSMGAGTHTLTVVLTPGYAAPEQYSSRGVQGPWTDVYGCAATLYRCITGHLPPEAQDRLSPDNPALLMPPSGYPDAEVSRRVDLTLVHALELDRNRRPQSIEEFQQALLLGHSSHSEMAVDSIFNGTAVKQHAKPQYKAIKSTSHISPVIWLIKKLLPLGAIFAVPAVLLFYSHFKNNPSKDEVPDNRTIQTSSSYPQTASAIKQDQSGKIINGKHEAPAQSQPQLKGISWEEAFGEPDPRIPQPVLPKTFAGMTGEQVEELYRVQQQPQPVYAPENIQRLEALSAAQQTAPGTPEEEPNLTGKRSDELSAQQQPSQLNQPVGHKFEAGDVLSVNLGDDVMLEMVWIPPGLFTMGSPETNSAWLSHENPQHRVTIGQGFMMGRFEVTQAQWQAVMGTSVRQQRDNAEFGQDLFGEGSEYPIYYVSWDECQEFIFKLNAQGNGTFRLPTEAEWEYACRAGTTTEYYFGNNESQLDHYAWYGTNSENTTHAVGRKHPNVWGLFDMNGNVSEWCEDDYHSDYIGAPTNGRAWIDSPRSDLRVHRGGSWDLNHMPCRSASRNFMTPFFQSETVGFRVILL